MKRRSRGEGSVFYDAGRGQWVGVLELERDPDTCRRVRRKVSASTKTGARDKLAELAREYRRSGITPSPTATVRSVVDDWLANLPPSVASPVSVQVITDHAARIKAEIGDVRLAKLTPGLVEAALRRMAAAGLSASTLSATRSVLVRSIRRAQRDGLVVRNVAELADTPRGTVRRSKSVTPDQVGKLLAAAPDAWWRAYVTLGVQCGLRPGELLALAWDDVDTEHGALRVRHPLKEEGPGRLVRADLKTPRSRRTVDMPAAVRPARADLRRQQAADKLQLGQHYTDSGLVLADSAGRACRPHHITQVFRQLCAFAGIGDGWQARELRHTFVSFLSHAGLRTEQIADAAGHANANITRGVYRHQLADTVPATATAMDAVWEQVSGR